LSVSALALSFGNWLVVEVVARADMDSSSAVAFGSAEITIGNSVGGANEIVIVVASTFGGRGDSKSQETGVFVFSERVGFLRRSSGIGGVVSNTPTIVSLGDSSETDEAFVLIALAINATDRTVNNRASGHCGESVRLSHKLGHIDESTQSVVCDRSSRAFIPTMDEVGADCSEQQHQDCGCLSEV
jgi:hypothetical protein